MTKQRCLVVNADDFGMVESATEAVLRGHRDGVISSASLVTTTTGFEHAARSLATHPKLGVGLHFTLSVGYPVAHGEGRALLIDSEGRFKWQFVSLWWALAKDRSGELRSAIAAELDAQVKRATDAGVPLDHINGERHIHLIPGIAEIVCDCARRHAIPYVRHFLNDTGIRYGRLRDMPLWLTNGGWLKLAVLRYLSRNARESGLLPALNLMDRYCTVLYTGKMHRVLPRVWADPPEGITELAVHPGEAHVADLPGLADPGLLAYLRHTDRHRELMACIELKSIDTPAKLMSYRELARSTVAANAGKV